MRILIVDDTEEQSKPLNQALIEEGFKTVVVYSGEDAIEILKYEKFDCIISDLNMPYISGFELVSNVREKDSSVPFILYTSSSSTKVLEELAMRLGVNKFIPNATMKEIYKAVKERINKAVGGNNDSTDLFLKT